MTIQAVVTWAQAQIKATSAAKVFFAPDYPTDTNLTVPSSIALADNIRFMGAGSGAVLITLFDLHIDILIPRGILEDAMQWFNGVPAAVANVFRADPKLGGTAETYDGDVTAKLAASKDGDMDVIGYTFIIPNIKLHE